MYSTTLRVLLLISMMFNVVAAWAADQSATWDNSTNNWSNATHWSTSPNFPNNGNGGFTYDAIVGGGAVTLDQAIAIEKLTLAGGSITNTSSFTLTLNDLFTWTGGTFSGPGSVSAEGGITISGASSKTLSGSRTLTNNGTADFSGGSLSVFSSGGAGAGAVLDNNSVFNVTDDADIILQDIGGNLPSFSNDGTFNKSGAGTTTSIGVAFSNAGTVNVDGGTLSLANGGTHSGTFSIDAGTTLNFGGGAHTLNATSDVNGAGTASFSSGTATVAGSYGLTGSTTVSGGTLNLNSASASSGSGTLSSGTLSGSAPLAVSGNFTWTGGTHSGTGSTSVGGTLAISGASSKTLSGSRTLTNNGTANFSGGSLSVFSSGGAAPGAVLDNNSVFNATDDADILLQNIGGSQPSFSNDGTFNKSGAATTTAIGVAFSNAGTINVSSGTLSLTGTLSNLSAGTLTGGTYRATGGGSAATLSVAGSVVSTLAGSTTIQLSGANSTITFGGTNLATSLANNVGTLRILNGHTFTMPNALNNTGTVELGGAALTDATLSSSTVTNSATAIISGHGTIVGNVQNAGTVSPGSSLGVLSITGDYTQTSAGKLLIELAGTTAGTTYDQLLVSGALALDGTLDVDLSFSPVANDSFVLFDWGSLSGSFTTLNLPALGGGLIWNTTQLYATGVLSVEGGSNGTDGDLNDDGFVDDQDIDILWNVIRPELAGDDDPSADDDEDLNGDSFVNEDDVDYLLANLLDAGTGRAYGDADLDGGVGGLDFTAWRLRAGTGWASGDFDGDGGIGGLDFTLWRTRPTAYPADVGPHAGGIAAVPEPASLALFVIGVLPLAPLSLLARRSRAFRAGFR